MFYINGAYVSESEAKISVLDLGLVRGYGVFDYLRTYQKRPFHLLEHLLRLQYSAKQIGIVLPYSIEEIEKIVNHLLLKTDEAEASIKIIVTGGVSPDQMIPRETPSLIAFTYPLKSYPDQFYTQGIKAITTTLSRSLPTSKTIQYIPAIIALQEGRGKMAQEALYLNYKREILEATTSNFFVFKGNTLLTPHSDEVLLGITREVILKLAKDHFPIEIRPISYYEIEEFDEAFITASNKEIMPLVQIDEQIIGNGRVGPRTQMLMQLFTAYTQERDWGFLNISRYQDKAQSEDGDLVAQSWVG